MTAVEWFYNEIYQLRGKGEMTGPVLNSLLKKARELEKQQLEAARQSGFSTGYYEGLYDCENK